MNGPQIATTYRYVRQQTLYVNESPLERFPLSLCGRSRVTLGEIDPVVIITSSTTESTRFPPASSNSPRGKYR